LKPAGVLPSVVDGASRIVAGVSGRKIVEYDERGTQALKITETKPSFGNDFKVIDKVNYVYESVKIVLTW
jgi:hypothetical protein